MITFALALVLFPTARTNAASPPSREWDVAAPALSVIIGGAPLHDWPTCRPGQIHAAAHTRASTYAVLGVVTLHARHCTLDVDHAVSALLDSHGRQLAIAVRTPPYADLGTPDRPDLAWDNGAGNWGFAWRGSWCGAPAAYVRIELRHGRYIRAPISGPQPACDPANSEAPLVERGIPAFPGQPVQPAPLEWSKLTASLQVPTTIDGTMLAGAVVTLTNTSDTSVALDPCPLFSVLVKNRRGDGGDAAFDRRLDCVAPASSVVPAEGALQVDLPAMNIYRNDYGRAAQNVLVTFSMAGVPVTTAQTRLAAQR